MVFCGFRSLSVRTCQWRSVFVWFESLLFGQSSFGSHVSDPTWKRKKAEAPVSSVSASSGNLAGTYCVSKRLVGSFTVEATFVCMVVFLSLATLLSQLYQQYDQITGRMILEEVLVKSRVVDASDDQNLLDTYRAYGERLGNPRLWLGAYRLEIEGNTESVAGKARAGSWEQEIKIQRFQPGRFLRRIESLKEFGEEWTNDGSGIQAGNEP